MHARGLLVWCCWTLGCVPLKQIRYAQLEHVARGRMPFPSADYFRVNCRFPVESEFASHILVFFIHFFSGRTALGLSGTGCFMGRVSFVVLAVTLLFRPL